MLAKSSLRIPSDISLEQIAGTLRQGLVITDVSGRILFVNEAFTETTGFSPDEAVGKNPRILQSGRQSSGFYRKMWNTIRRTGHWDGEVVNRRKDGRLYNEWLTISGLRDPLGRTTHYLGILRDVTDRARAMDRAQRRADQDGLTGLPNRGLFLIELNRAIARARRTGERIAVIFLDVDRFKDVNDALGHLAGDHLLKTIAERLRRSVRETDIVARYGGDEFVLVLPDVAGPSYAEWVARKLAVAVGHSMKLEGKSFSPAASMGISLYPDDGSDAVSLIRSADAAMYRAKKAARNRFDLPGDAWSTP